MSFAHWSAIAVWAIFPLAAVAQDKPKQSDPANPAVAVPATAYVSALSDYQTYSEPKDSSIKVWRAANDDMGRIGGHMGQIKEASMPMGHDKHPKSEGK